MPRDSVPGNHATINASDKLISLVIQRGLPVKKSDTVGMFASFNSFKCAKCFVPAKFRSLLSPAYSAYGGSP